MTSSCKSLHISKLIINQLRILHKLRCCWSIHCMKHLWTNWFIVGTRKQYWVMAQKSHWIRWNFNNACNASFYYGTCFFSAKASCAFHHIQMKYTIYLTFHCLLDGKLLFIQIECYKQTYGIIFFQFQEITIPNYKIHLLIIEAKLVFTRWIRATLQCWRAHQLKYK